MPKEEYLTEAKFNELKEELEFLKHTRRKEIAEELEHAKLLGDIAENAEYHEARNNQRETEERIFKLENIIKNAVIIKPHHDDVVSPGATVIISKDGIDKKKFQIVGSEEVDMSSGRISVNSPIGAAMVGKRKGEKFDVILPNGHKTTYTVIEIE